jgi:hypothetical protein
LVPATSFSASTFQRGLRPRILGGLAICAVLTIARRNHRLALDFLALGALPFAIATWWSVVTPLIAAHLPW